MATNGLAFFDVTAEKLYEQFIKKLQALTGEKLYEGDERLIYMQSMLVIIVALLNMCNEETKARMLRFAYGEILDAIGDFKRCTRLQPAKATCTMKFSTNKSKAYPITIPIGTRVSDGNYIFRVLATGVLEAGRLDTLIEVECEKGGNGANHLPIGSISTMIDNIIGITGCTNVTTTTGGDDGEPYPYDADKYPDGDDGTGDNRYRERIRLSNAAYSCAGSEDAYIYWAKTASADIIDVGVISEQVAGTIDLVVMTKDGTPTNEIIEKVNSICSSKKVRPMNDIVNVIPPETITYNIKLEYTIMDGNQNLAIIDLTDEEKGAFSRFAEYTGARLGRDINADLLHHYCMQAGSVYSCKVIEPESLELKPNQVAKWSGVFEMADPTVKFGE